MRLRSNASIARISSFCSSTGIRISRARWRPAVLRRCRAHPERFNLAPRLDGPHPIGEKDLGNQVNYIAARPATIGALIVVASRVRSGPVEITSLVRHAEYQSVLKGTNGNATTSVPMHTMGLAFDIALVNTPMSRVQEIRRVLQEMRAAGDILFIGERQQLVFHVVPQPSRLGYFTGIYHQAVGAVSGSQVVEVVAPGPPRLEPARLTPRVITEVVAVSPVSGQWQDWTAADPRTADDRRADRCSERHAAGGDGAAARTARVPGRARHVRLANRQSFVIVPASASVGSHATRRASAGWSVRLRGPTRRGPPEPSA